ncbi:MAG TPA: zinc ribbon domain-containing protein [Tepidiformaceae bacterium]|nr:zinc ribbon domain-containing protein [Tepidiformaceae bacterium]
MFDSWPGGSWQATLQFAGAIIAIYLAAIWVALVFWTYRDIRQRSRDPILQTVAVLLVLIFFLPGHWVYLIVRPRYTLSELYERSLEEEALLQELEDQKACPTCKRRVSDEFLLCPSCRTQLKEACRQCSKPLSYAWVACPYCGLEKPVREGYGPRPVRAPGARPQAANPRPRPMPQPGAVEQARPVPPNNPRPPMQSAAASPQPQPAPRPRDPFGTARTPANPAGNPGEDGGPVIGQ